MCVLFCVSRSACPSSTTSSPTQCLAGTYAPEGSTSCSTCDAGYQCPVNGMSTQDACTNGTYADSTSSTSCDPCPAGQLCNSFFFFPLVLFQKSEDMSSRQIVGEDFSFSLFSSFVFLFLLLFFFLLLFRFLFFFLFFFSFSFSLFIYA